MNMPPLIDQDAASNGSSSMSSPQSLSPPQHPADVARRSAYSAFPGFGEGVVNSHSAISAQPSHAQNTPHNANGYAPKAEPEVSTKPKRQPRKSKDAKPPGDEKPKEKKPRKPREPKVKKEPEASAAPARKRQKTEDKATPTPADAPAGPRQSTIKEMVNNFQSPGLPASAPQPQQYQQPPPRPQQSTPSDNLVRSSVPPHASNTPTPRPYSSGQNYDPIRGSTIESAPPRPTATTNGAHTPAQASPHINRASESPSIISLIDPPPATKTSAPAISYPAQTMGQTHAQLPPAFATKQSPTPPRATPISLSSTSETAPAAAAATAPAPHRLSQTSAAQQPISAGMDGAMDIDGPACEVPAKQPPEIKVTSKASSSAAPTPKPAAAKANSPPKATGSGLLSSSNLFGGPSADKGTERKGVDIDIRIALNPNGGNTVNIAQEIAKRYGRDAINPRAAAHRERLLQVAAAANRLEGGSADDMSVDLMSEVDGDSNIEMGGMDEEKSATGEEKPRKRRKKVEEYDKEDDFIDDTELAWQEQAAVAKDGFFVYSGPLIPEGQTANVESTTTTRGRGGRGRGRGRAAAAAANGTTHATLAEKNKDPNAPTTGRGRGRGRGTGAPRKPRITKADRERMQEEKADRERMAAQPASHTTAPPVVPSQPILGSTPMPPHSSAYAQSSTASTA